MKGFQKVFKFTAARRMDSWMFKLITLGIALILFCLPFFAIPMVEKSAGEEGYFEDEGEDEIDSEADPSQVSAIYFVNESPALVVNEWPQGLTLDGFDNAAITVCEDYKAAAELAKKNDTSLMLVLTDDTDDSFFVKAILPDNSSLSYDDVMYLCDVAYENSDQIICALAGVELVSAEANVSISQTISAGGKGNEELSGQELEIMKEIMNYVLPYLNIMLIYFLVLYYGQGVAQSCIMEKSSKLMDTFLVSVEPKALLTGKVLANVTLAIGQVLLWGLSLIAGLWLGLARAEAIHESLMSTLSIVVKMCFSAGGLIDPVKCLMAAVMVSSGFLLYCSLAAIGGSLASRQEELGTTNFFFTGILIVSFFVTLKTGLFNDAAASAGIIDFVPFTSVLITPARLLIGSVTMVQGLVSLAITLVLAFLVLAFSGKLYLMMSFYRGDVPKLKNVIKMVFGKA